MTREDVKKIFVSCTDSEITEFLNQYHAELEKAKAKDDESKAKAKEESEKLKALETEKAELAKKLEEAENSNLTELEKMTKNFEAAQAEIAQLKQAQFISNQRADAVAQFKITAEQAKEVVKDDGSFDMVKLGGIISEKESAAALAKEQEIARMSSNPNGQNGETTIESLAEQKAKERAARRTAGIDNDVINMYRR